MTLALVINLNFNKHALDHSPSLIELTMMFRILNAILLLTAVSAFSPAIGPRTMTRATSLRMFSDDNTPKPLESVSAPKSEEERAAKIEEFKKSIVKDMNTGEIREVNWVDPAMAANTA